MERRGAADRSRVVVISTSRRAPGMGAVGHDTEIATRVPVTEHLDFTGVVMIESPVCVNAGAQGVNTRHASQRDSVHDG